MSYEQIKKYFTPDNNFIKPIKRANPLKNKEEFIEILIWWNKISMSDTIGDLKELKNNTPLIYLQISSSSYYINAVSNKTGIKEFLKNKDESWKIIINENGVENKVTNRNNKEAIPGFYLYKEI